MPMTSTLPVPTLGATLPCVAGGSGALCSVEAAELSPTLSSLWHTQSSAGPVLKMGSETGEGAGSVQS